jgi:hypothetical protein
MSDDFLGKFCMQANPAEQNALDAAPIVFGATSSLVEAQAEHEYSSEHPPIAFHGNFASAMEMYASAEAVGQYLDGHRSWFNRCAHPMKANPIGENGYDLTVGRFGAFGYDVEAKLGLDLLPGDHGIYRIQTIPIPGYHPPGYDINFQAELQLVESVDPQSGQPMTHVEWDLDLQVAVHFPRFIYAMPRTMIQTTGDRLLNQIVRQVSRYLTHKVQEDFHKAAGIQFPKKRRMPWAKNKEMKLELAE